MDGIILLNKNTIIYKKKQKTSVSRKERFECICGGRYTKANKAVHVKSGIHTNYTKTKK